MRSRRRCARLFFCGILSGIPSDDASIGDLLLSWQDYYTAALVGFYGGRRRIDLLSSLDQNDAGNSVEITTADALEGRGGVQ